MQVFVEQATVWFHDYHHIDVQTQTPLNVPAAAEGD